MTGLSYLYMTGRYLENAEKVSVSSPKVRYGIGEDRNVYFGRVESGLYETTF